MNSVSNPANEYRVFVCYADTGGGHKYAAEAIKTAIKELVEKDQDMPPVNVIIESVVRKTNFLNNLFVELYNYLLRHHQDWMKYYFWFIELIKPNQTMLGYKACEKYLHTVLARVRPSIIVSVHPMVNHYMALALQDAGIADRTKLIIVLTDPNGTLWSGWACPDAELTIAPNDLARNSLIELGIAPDRIRTIGMPIEPKFVHPANIKKEDSLKLLGLDPARLTVLLSGGWSGGGAVMKIYRALELVKRPIQVIVLCGHNESLLARMKQLKEQSSLPTVVLAFTESLSQLMSISDLLVTKGGGLTTFEAIARRLPMVLDLLTEPMPQELGTVNMLIEANLAKPLRKVEDIVPIVESLKLVEDRESQTLPSEHNLDRTDAIYEIAETILSFRPQTVMSTQQKSI
jgi:UDP-N-acetylglucosamine:LPS N-acetylglucosamine transferase